MLRINAQGNSPFECSTIVKPNPNIKCATAIPVMLVNSIRLLPTLSSKNVATRMNDVLITPTPTVASKSLSLLVIPAFLKILGLYNTTASIPVACWKKCSPIATTRIQRTVVVGDNSSFHTPSP
ncbi:hypothetical protein IC582_018415 [Cucumis melo]